MEPLTSSLACIRRDYDRNCNEKDAFGYVSGAVPLAALAGSITAVHLSSTHIYYTLFKRFDDISHGNKDVSQIQQFSFFFS